MASKKTGNKRVIARKDNTSNRVSEPVSVSKQRKLTPAQELRAIERMLGDEFDTLAEARRVLKRETVAVNEHVKKQVSQSKIVKTPKIVETSKVIETSIKRIPPSKAIELRSLTNAQKKKVEDFIGDAAAAKKLGETLKNKDEYFYAMIPFNVRDPKTGKITTKWSRTYEHYSNLGQLFTKLSEYKTRNYKMKISSMKTKRWLNSIQIGRFTGTTNEYDTIRKRESEVIVKARKERAKWYASHPPKKGKK